MMPITKTFPAALIAGSCLCGIAAMPAIAQQYTDSALAAAGVIGQARAEAIAQRAVPDGRVIAAAFEKGDAVPHWSVDLVSPNYDY